MCQQSKQGVLTVLSGPDRADISSAREAEQHHAEQRQAGGGHGAHEDGAA